MSEPAGRQGRCATAHHLVRMWIPENGREYQRAYTLTRINRAQASAIILFLHHEPAGRRRGGRAR